jgi:hypothetical protein
MTVGTSTFSAAIKYKQAVVNRVNHGGHRQVRWYPSNDVDVILLNYKHRRRKQIKTGRGGPELNPEKKKINFSSHILK